MSLSESKLTLQQERTAYRRAVLSSLQVFFDKSPKEALALVDGWWERMGKGEVFSTGLFMHDEPINTAADLAGCKTVPAIRDIRETYSRIIAEAMPKPRKFTRKKPQDISPMARAA